MIDFLMKSVKGFIAGGSSTRKQPPSSDVLTRQLLYATTRHARYLGSQSTVEMLRALESGLTSETSWLSLTLNDLREEDE